MMHVAAEGDKDYAYGGRFTGTVLLEMLREAGREGEADVARVHSESGACTKWHSHPGGQVLVLVAGTGRAGDRDGDHRELPVGTYIVTPPDTAHWHGAEDGREATWLAITYGTTDWTDESPVA